MLSFKTGLSSGACVVVEARFLAYCLWSATNSALAMYKGRKDGSGIKVWAARLVDWAIRTITRSPYSHCEIAIRYSGGLFDCYSSSARDGGVRLKTMPLPSGKWDLVELPAKAGLSAKRLFRRTHGAGYDYPGALGAVFRLPQSRRRWFCSEWCAYAIGCTNPHRYNPQTLYAAVLTKEKMEGIK